MRINFGKKTFVTPMPVLIIGTYDKDNNPDAMVAAWGGIYDTGKIFLSFAKHKTTDNIKLNNCFTLSFATEDTISSCDYVGLVSFNKDKDKISKSGLTPVKSDFINAPFFKELKCNLDCVVEDFSEDSDGIKVIANIVNVGASDSVITNNKIDLEKLKPVSFDTINNKYFSIGKIVADAFKVGNIKK